MPTASRQCTSSSRCAALHGATSRPCSGAAATHRQFPASGYWYYPRCQAGELGGSERGGQSRWPEGIANFEYCTVRCTVAGRVGVILYTYCMFVAFLFLIGFRFLCRNFELIEKILSCRAGERSAEHRVQEHTRDIPDDRIAVPACRTVTLYKAYPSGSSPTMPVLARSATRTPEHYA